jgi:hypothetical protein
MKVSESYRYVNNESPPTILYLNSFVSVMEREKNSRKRNDISIQE